ncbi:hypothetical protein DUNSADRAFT_4159 [Dunaliella salina]|uniref:Encoded protein n=1 Tax=Dunaliella salina TaxID=3046 RepID=A0ABQ7GSL7_DUNSA|nr:hypothetical protein DUNSADRAFT_4159 [Dunaliella salina]|eukprot:KAF5837588.1 hypothetical protein DUNSADRAFT_4159 [Dunaliella salina]
MAPTPIACAWRVTRQLQLSSLASSMQLAQALQASMPAADLDECVGSRSSSGCQLSLKCPPHASPSLPPLLTTILRHSLSSPRTRAPVLQAATAAATPQSLHAYSTTASTTTTTTATTSHKTPNIPTAAVGPLAPLSVSPPGLAARPEPASAGKDSAWSLPNMLSIARGLSGPGIAYLVLQEQWPWALSALTVSGVSMP